MLEILRQFTLLETSLFFLLANTLIVLTSVIGCWFLGRVFHSRRIFPDWEPITGGEIVAAISTLLINVAISVAGWWLWQLHIITLTEPTVLNTFCDPIVMVLGMDVGMYALHRVAHYPLLYIFFHYFHHRHEVTNPISLFVLHPLEVIGFGGLMISFLMIYPMSLYGLLIFLTLNVLFGTLGHSGVEPFPKNFNSIPILKLTGTSTFHAEHHEHPNCNFGFYTLIWDRLFGTLDPQYEERFANVSPQ